MKKLTDFRKKAMSKCTFPHKSTTINIRMKNNFWYMRTISKLQNPKEERLIRKFKKLGESTLCKGILRRAKPEEKRMVNLPIKITWCLKLKTLKNKNSQQKKKIIKCLFNLLSPR